MNRETVVDETRRSQFGSTLRQFREAAALSQEELAERAGLSVRGISDLERGARSTPRLETVRMLADGLELGEAERRELLAARSFVPDVTTPSAVHAAPALPVPVTPFIGREEELETIARMVQVDHHRLITLLGPGGVGKTRLAIQTAHQLAASFRDGATFVDLSPIRGSDLVLPAIASRLGVTEQAGRSLRDGLVVALQGRQLLLVLDNLEQVIGAATDIAWLHASAPELVVIATSRVRLHVAAEQVLPIDPLSLPADDDINALQQVHAVSLFIARVKAIDHGFALNDENAPVVAEIVRKLQGMPLAIELAAARVRLLPVPDLLDRLETQLSVLGVGTRDAPARQRTIRDTISWSYDLLSSTEQAAFRTLSIFPDGCTLETAGAVLGVDNRFDQTETLDLMESLVDSSMLRRREGTDGQVRFQMLQTLQEFGLEELAAAAEENMARRAAHATWCVPLARQMEWVMFRPDIVDWLNRMEAELQNARAHVSWLSEHDYVEDALDISASLSFFRTIRGHFSEGRRELEMLLAHPATQARTVLRMRGLLGLGMICNNQGDPVQSVRAIEAGIGLARELGEQRHLAWALIGLGVSMSQKGDLDRAEALTRESIALGKEMGDKQIIAGGTTNLGVVFDQRGDLDRAYEYMQEGLAQSQSINNFWGAALGQLNLSLISLRRGYLDQAQELLLNTKQLFTDLGDQRDLPLVYLSLADVARLRGDVTTAERWLEQSLEMAHETGAMLDIAQSYLGLAQTARLKDDITASQIHTCNAIQWYERSGDLVDAALCVNNLADSAVATGDLQRAAWCIGAVDGALAKHGRSRIETIPGEHQARIESIRSVLSDNDWQSNYGRAFSMSEHDILAEVKSWLSCYETSGENALFTGHAGQSGYDGGRR